MVDYREEASRKHEKKHDYCWFESGENLSVAPNASLARAATSLCVSDLSRAGKTIVRGARRRHGSN